MKARQLALIDDRAGEPVPDAQQDARRWVRDVALTKPLAFRHGSAQLPARCWRLRAASGPPARPQKLAGAGLRRLHRSLRGRGEMGRVCPKTVRRVLRKGAARKERGPSKLAPFEAAARYKALECGGQVREIFRYIRELGFDGGETIVKKLVREIRPRPARRPALRFETAEGQQGQVDLSPYDGVKVSY